MPASSSSVARSLASRLNSVLPSAVRIIPDGGKLEIMIEGRRMGVVHTLERLEDDGVNFTRMLAGTVVSVLSLIQDDVSEYLRDPWPSRDGLEMAVPHGRLDAHALHLWYGEAEERAVVSLDAISMGELGALVEGDGQNASGRPQ